MASQMVPDLFEGDRLEWLVDGCIAQPELYLANGVEVRLRTMASPVVPDTILRGWWTGL